MYDFGAIAKNMEFGFKPKYVRVLQTHISWVILTGRYAFKIKKPVDFGFLNFSTLRRRHLYCRREVDINRKFSRWVYIGVLPVVKRGDKFSIGGKGRVVDYCVKMREIPQSCLMSAMLENGRSCKRAVDQIAGILHRYYKRSEINDRLMRYGSLKTIKFNWSENFEQTKRFVGKFIEEKEYNFIKRKVYSFMKSKKDIFRKRVRDRRIRWCHGDLHTQNIFIHKGRVYIFDAIEFNKRFACSDVASDVAFLLMDLEFREKHSLSRRFLKRFLELEKDFEMLKLLNFYKCYRAYVRMKVTLFRLDEVGGKGRSMKEHLERYLQLSLNYSRDFSP